MRLEPVEFNASAFSSDTEEERSLLINSMQHDLRHPLQVIFLTHRRLLTRLTDPTLIKTLHAAELAYNDLCNSIDDAIDTLRVGLKAQRVNKVALSIESLLFDINAKYQAEAERSGIELRTRSARLTVISDKRVLTRIITNLVVNALVHSRASRILVGSRLVRASPTGRVKSSALHDLTIDVMDNGQGIPATDLPHIFRPGYRGSRTCEKHGQGLGLYNVHGLVTELGGLLLLASEVGRGTHFRIRLPACVQRGPRLPTVDPTDYSVRISTISEWAELVETVS